MATPVQQEISVTGSVQYAAYDHTKATADCISMITARAPLYEPQSRSAVDIVAVIDRSGSMAGVKLDLVRKTLLFVIDQCEYCVCASLCVYVCMCVHVFVCVHAFLYTSMHIIRDSSIPDNQSLQHIDYST